MYILQVNQELYTMLPKKGNQYQPQHAAMHQLLAFYVISKCNNLFTSSNMHPQNRQPSKEAGATHTADLMHALMQRSTIILHHHQFKDGLIQGLINNVTWIDDMAQGVALIPPLNYKYPLTSSHSRMITRKKSTPHLSQSNTPKGLGPSSQLEL